MVINLFDFNFRQSVCSVAYQTPQYIEYVRDQLDFDGVTLFTDNYINSDVIHRVNSRYNIGWLREPYCLHPDTYKTALVNAHRFDFILTYYQPYLDMAKDPGHALYGKFKFCPYGGTWIDRRDWGIKPKTKLCSMLIGSKMSTRGHQIRHEIADMITLMGYDVDFYGVRGTPVDYGQETKLQVLSDYCFSIVTETCREQNLFTEWLLDCYAVGTVPIYWGAPNAGYLFGWNGLLEAVKVRDFSDWLQNIDQSEYNKMMPHVENSLERMQPFAVTEDWLYLNVLKEFE